MLVFRADAKVKETEENASFSLKSHNGVSF